MHQTFSNQAIRSEADPRGCYPAQAVIHASDDQVRRERGLRDPKAIIRLAKLLELLGISRSTVYLRLNPESQYYDPRFPKSIRLGAKSVGWILADVYAYIECLRNRNILPETQY